MNFTDLMHEVKLINETCSASQARDVISGVIDKQINFYKLQQLSQWIKNHNQESNSIDEKINELHGMKQELADVLSQAQRDGRPVRVNGSFTFSID